MSIEMTVSEIAEVLGLSRQAFNNRVKELPEEESQHCIKVLRLSEGTEIMLTDGKGTFYKAIITLAHHKRCGVKIVEEIQALSPCPIKIHIAIKIWTESNGLPKSVPK